jgi:hypothetical protein
MEVMRLFEGTHENVGMLRQKVMQRSCASLWFTDNKEIWGSQCAIHHVTSTSGASTGAPLVLIDATARIEVREVYTKKMPF